MAKADTGMIWHLIRGPKPLQTEKREVWIWPATDQIMIPPLRVTSTNKQVCELEGTLYSAGQHSKGVAMEIIASSKSGEIQDIFAAAPGADAGSPEVVDNGLMTTRKIAFQTPALERFAEYHYRVFLQATKPTTSNDCELYAKQVKVAVH